MKNPTQSDWTNCGLSGPIPSCLTVARSIQAKLADEITYELHNVEDHPTAEKAVDELCRSGGLSVSECMETKAMWDIPFAIALKQLKTVSAWIYHREREEIKA